MKNFTMKYLSDCGINLSRDASYKLRNFFLAITNRKIKNKKQAEKVFKLKKINVLKQIHSDKIVVIKNAKSVNGIKADGMITTVRNFPVAVKIADCIGSIMVDPEKKVIAVIHSGWRGVAGKIILKTVKKMKKSFGVKPDNVIVIMSPSIGPCCYEIGSGLYKKLKKQKIFSNIFVRRKNRIFMDLQKANENMLLSAGVRKKNIFLNRVCTKCNNDLFFSYRAEGKKAGRMFVVGMIR
jgi:YfiH family protein